MPPADMTDVNGFMPPASAQRAAWLLAGCFEFPPVPTGGVSAGEFERLELVDTIASHIRESRTIDSLELTVWRRLLEHLGGPSCDELP